MTCLHECECLCKFCGQPMKPKGVKKLPDQYDHAQGCPYSRKRITETCEKEMPQELALGSGE